MRQKGLNLTSALHNVGKAVIIGRVPRIGIYCRSASQARLGLMQGHRACKALLQVTAAPEERLQREGEIGKPIEGLARAMREVEQS